MLRALELEDAPAVTRLAGEKEIAATTLRIPHPYEQCMAEKWIGSLEQLRADGRTACFAVCVHEGRELVGCISLEIEPAHRRAELGYWIGRPHWNRGYATEAGSAVLEFGFDMLHLHRIYASHFASNPASGKVLKKIGFKEEGRLRDHLEKWGSFHDSVLWGLTEDDYLKLASERVSLQRAGCCCGGHE